MIEEMKQCTGLCGRLLPRWMFHINPTASDGLRSECADCVAKRSSNFRKQHPDYIRQRKYNMYPGQWDDELKKQNYECDFPSCHCKENLVVDHDHKTGKFRAILCKWHNAGLGNFNDNSQLLREAADYLEKHSV